MSFSLEKYKKPLAYGQYSLTDDEYFKIEALNYSSIKEVSKGPLYAEFALNNQYRPKTKSLDFGKVFHCYLYEPEKFAKTYFFSDFHMDGRKKADKKRASDEVVWKGAGKTRIDLNQAEEIKRMKEAIMKNPYCRALIEMPGKCESTLLWKHSAYELNFKSRFDKLPKQDFIIDLKTTKASYESSFKSDIFKYGYHIQAALYSDAYETLFGEMRDYVIIAISKSEPYVAQTYDISKETRKNAREIYYQHVETLIEYSVDPDIIYTPIKI